MDKLELAGNLRSPTTSHKKAKTCGKVCGKLLSLLGELGGGLLWRQQKRWMWNEKRQNKLEATRKVWVCLTVSHWEFIQNVAADSSSDPDREGASGKHGSQVNKFDKSMLVHTCLYTYVYIHICVCVCIHTLQGVL